MYTYTKLKEAIIGSGNTVPKDWSPNAIRALVISGNFIFVAYHTRQPKCIQLDVSQVMDDLNHNGSTGSLGNLLKQKQLSCLEEIYIDSVYSVYKGVFNLEDYVSSLINTKSRLRFWGYCTNLSCDELLQKFSTAQINQLSDYCYALDSQRSSTLQYTTVENPNWYTKYNLRPDKYSADNPNGVLAKYFARIRKEIEGRYEAELAKLTANSVKEAIVLLYNQDCKNLKNISLFLELLNVLKDERSQNLIIKSVLDCLRDIYKSVYSNKVQIKREDFIGYLNGATKPNEALNKLYQSLALFNTTESKLDLETLVKRTHVEDGLTGFHTSLNESMVRFVGELNRSKGDAYLMLVCILTEMDCDIRNGDISGVVKEIGTRPTWFEDYLQLLMGMGGYTEETLTQKYSSTRRV